MPRVLSNKYAEKLAHHEFPQLKKHFGPDVKLNITVGLKPDNRTDAIKFDPDFGIVLDNVETVIKIYASNETVTNFEALQINTELSVSHYYAFRDLYIYE